MPIVEEVVKKITRPFEAKVFGGFLFYFQEPPYGYQRNRTTIGVLFRELAYNVYGMTA
jgi:hypothetical protein